MHLGLGDFSLSIRHHPDFSYPHGGRRKGTALLASKPMMVLTLALMVEPPQVFEDIEITAEVRVLSAHFLKKIVFRPSQVPSTGLRWPEDRILRKYTERTRTFAIFEKKN